MTTTQVIKFASHIIDLWLPEKIKYEAIPGISIGIVHKGKVVFKKGYGFADLENKVTTGVSTLYPIASISKVFTVIAIMQLKEKGLLKIDDTVNHHLPWFELRDNKNKIKKITILDLLTHTSGIWRDGNTYHWFDDKFPTETEIRSAFTSDAFKIKGGKKFKYSNYGYALLGLVIESVSGKRYGDYVQANICAKLNMDSTTVGIKKPTQKKLAVGYGKFFPNRPREVFKVLPHSNVYASAAGLVSNVQDLAKLLSVFSCDSKIISKRSLSQMQKIYNKTSDGDIYGLGIDILKLGKKRIVGHSGGFSGYSLNIGYDKIDDVGVIILSNAIGVSAQGMTLGIFDMIARLKKDYTKYTRNLQIKRKSAQLEGYYQSRWVDEIIVALDKHFLSLGLWNNFPLKNADLLESNNDGTFTVRSKNSFGMNGETVRFKHDKNSNKITLDYGSAVSHKAIAG